uniref:Uncharacterized protein n=1 Tax=Setaria digitata TaxID=48799 RepID=A0A915PJH7_9BILA
MVFQRYVPDHLIQKFIRGWLARKFFRRLLNEYNEKERENASVVIQKYFRSWLARKSFRKMQHEILQKQENAACILQKFTRRWLAQKSYKKLLDEHNAQEQENASLIIQKCIRSWLARKSIRKMRDEKTLQKREDAARILQRYIRRWIARKNNQKKQRVELVPHEQGNITLTLQNSIVTMDGATDEVGIKEAYDCKIISDVECLQMLRELKRRHNCLRKRRQNFLRAVEDKMRLAIILKEEKDRRIKAATLIQARWRGYNLRKHCEAICNKLTATRIARNEVASSEEKAERMQPIINRVMTEMGNLNSDRLYVRYRATEVLYKFVGLSQLCAQYVFENGGLECILDSLEGCNRGVGSTEVVIRLCSVMWSVLKFKAIRDKLCESRQQDIVKQCYHFMLAFHRVPDVVTYLSRIVVALDGQQYKKASYFVAELTKKFAKLSGCDERIIALRNLQNHLN